MSDRDRPGAEPWISREVEPETDVFEAGEPPAEAPPTPARPAVPAPTETDRVREFVGTGLFWGLVVGVILAILVIVFSAQNTDTAPITFLWMEWSSPIFAVILVSLLVGIVLDEIVGLLFRSRRRRRLAEREELKRLRKQSGR
jgi:uncharacterized integral membrane protein